MKILIIFLILILAIVVVAISMVAISAHYYRIEEGKFRKGSTLIIYKVKGKVFKQDIVIHSYDILEDASSGYVLLKDSSTGEIEEESVSDIIRFSDKAEIIENGERIGVYTHFPESYDY